MTETTFQKIPFKDLPKATRDTIALNAQSQGISPQQYYQNRGGVNKSGVYGDSYVEGVTLTDEEYAAVVQQARNAGATGVGFGDAINRASAKKRYDAAIARGVDPAIAQSEYDAAITATQGMLNQSGYKGPIIGGDGTGGIGGGAGGGGGTGGGGGMSQGMRSARDSALLLAEQYGLGGDFFNQIENLLYEDISEASLILALRSTDAYKKRFAANATRVAKGLPALSESEYIRMEQLYRQELRAAGLPPTFYDDMEDFKTYIENDLSYNEFVGRVGLARRASQMANPEVKRQLKDLYQVGEDQLVAYFLNPQKTTTMLQRQFNVAQTAGALSRAGFGTTMAEELTSTVTGGSPETVLNYGELEAAAQTAATARPLSMEVLGGEGGAVTEQDLLRGVVAEDVQAQRRIQREQQKRLAEYQAGGSLLEAQQGVLGLRSAAR